MLITSTYTFAQDIKFGIKAGLNLPTMKTEIEGMDIDSKANLNFQIGGYVDFDFEKFSIQPGLVLNGKGSKVSVLGLESKSSLMYLEVPVNFYYKVPLNFGNIYLGGGPYAGYGISGKSKTKGELLGETLDEEEDIKFGDDEDFKALDFGLNFGGGVRLTNGLALGANYGLGLSNMSNDDDAKAKNRVLSFTVGYFF